MYLAYATTGIDLRFPVADIYDKTRLSKRKQQH